MDTAVREKPSGSLLARLSKHTNTLQNKEVKTVNINDVKVKAVYLPQGEDYRNFVMRSPYNAKHFLFFKPSHSATLYSEASSLISEDEVHELVSKDNETERRERIVIVNIDRLTSNPLFKQNIDLQDRLLYTIQRELANQTLTTIKAIMQELEDTKDEFWKQVFTTQLEQAYKNLGAPKIQHEAIKYFLDMCREKGVELGQSPYFKKINGLLLDNQKLIEQPNEQKALNQPVMEELAAA